MITAHPVAEADDGAVSAYFAACRRRVPAFTARHFRLAGTLRLHRQALGLDLLLAPLNVFFRDVGTLLPQILTFWMLLTPIFFDRALLRADLGVVEMQKLRLRVPGEAFDDSRPILILHLWATWCVPCRKEMPALDKLQQTRLP